MPWGGRMVKSADKRTTCRSRLAGDGIDSAFQMHRGDAIASKPAPTTGVAESGLFEVLEVYRVAGLHVQLLPDVFKH
ncbi:hypothetical protein SAMN04490194_4783 [Pseudomonas migulae]|uniref:Uncharacterized protein n=1 Tax=Pseudomonas migulae TaxID=78543 RepID=A0A1H5MJJ6_9PSED|nr:hypothetical protein SAMN04490194_4783 [Pseudomonas migulae]